MNVEKKCNYLLPWQNFVPTFVPFVVGRIVSAYKIKSSGTMENNSFQDFFGVSKEIKISNVGIPIVMLYFILSSDSRFDRILHGFPRSFILIFLPVTNGLAAIIIPSIKLVLKAIHVRKLKPQSNHTFVVRSDARVDIKSVSNILESDAADLFRKHAVRCLCSESVDFCIDAIAYKRHGESLVNIEGAYQPQHLKLMHERFLKIVDEFISNNSPCEVNISGLQKARILKFKNFEIFATLGQQQVVTIFEEAKKETELLLAVNILDSFFQIHPDLIEL